MTRKTKRKQNPDVDVVVSRGQRYKRALENYVEAVDSGRGLAAARREVKAAKAQFQDSMGIGAPLTIAAAAVGAGAGAAAFGPVGAMIGAVFAGAAPSIVEAIPDSRTQGDDPDDGPQFIARGPQFIARGARPIPPMANNPRGKARSRRKNKTDSAEREWDVRYKKAFYQGKLITKMHARTPQEAMRNAKKLAERGALTRDLLDQPVWIFEVTPSRAASRAANPNRYKKLMR